MGIRNRYISVPIGSAAVLVLVSLSWGRWCGESGSSQQESWVSYEPAIIELTGVLTVSERFGPPNYGENVQTDARLEVPVLVLSEAVNVRGDSSSEVNTEFVRGITEVQLVFLRAHRYDELVNRRVIARGTLSHAMSGHHFTEVVMTVEDLWAAP